MNQPEFETYWQKRTALRSTKYWRDADNVSKAIKKAYITNYNQLQKEMASIYTKYMKTGKGTYKAAYVKQLMTNISVNSLRIFIFQFLSSVDIRYLMFVSAVFPSFTSTFV